MVKPEDRKAAILKLMRSGRNPEEAFDQLTATLERLGMDPQGILNEMREYRKAARELLEELKK